MIEIYEGNFGFTVSNDILKDVCREFGMNCEWNKFEDYLERKKVYLIIFYFRLCLCAFF